MHALADFATQPATTPSTEAATVLATDPATDPATEASRPLERIVVRGDGRTLFLRPADVDWCESAGNYVKLHVGRVVHVVRDTLSGLEDRLDPSAFIRIHRRLIVNLDRVHALQPWFGGDQIVILKDGARLRLSRTFKDKVAGKLLVTG